MNENDSFALVPRPPDALEKVKPRTKRILSGMVVDTLALAKTGSRPFRILLVYNEEGPRKLMEHLIRGWVKDVDLLPYADSQEAWIELSQTNPDLLITNDIMAGMRGEEIVRRLEERKVLYPIVVVSGWESVTKPWVREYARRGLNITFLNAPFSMTDFRRVLELSLKMRPLRIVILDDEEGPRQAGSQILKGCYDSVQIFDFENGQSAWDELSRSEPDLFITDIRHPGLSCNEMLARLAERKVEFPILIMSAIQTGEWRAWGPGLNVSFLSKPWDITTFRTAVEAALQVPTRRAP